MKGLIRNGRRRVAASVFVLLLGATGALAAEDVERRCETRLEPRAIYGRNYVLDRIHVCRRVERPVPPSVVPTPRPAPPSVFGGTIEGEGQRATWDRTRSTLGNAQYERSVRAGRRGVTRREG